MITLEPIGVIRTNRAEHDTTPVQTRFNWDEPGEIHLDAAFTLGLEGLDGFSHLWVVTWLHRAGEPTGDETPLTQTPFLLRPRGETKGIFAIRGPKRPNPIGLHLVRIASVNLTPPIVYFHGVDMVDETPVLDIKPWVSQFDLPPETSTRSGWYDDLNVQNTTPAELAREKEEDP